MMKVKERTVGSGDSVPVGMGQRPKVVLNLLKSFDDLHEVLDEVAALKLTNSNKYKDSYPEMQKHGFLFKLNGKENADGTKSLDKRIKYQKSPKGKTGRKAPKVNVTPVPSRAPC